MRRAVTVGKARLITDRPGGRESAIWECDVTEVGETTSVQVEIVDSATVQSGITIKEVVVSRVAQEYDQLDEDLQNLDHLSSLGPLPINSLHTRLWEDVAPDHRCPSCSATIPLPSTASTFEHEGLGFVRFLYRADCHECRYELVRDVLPGSTWTAREHWS